MSRFLNWFPKFGTSEILPLHGFCSRVLVSRFHGSFDDFTRTTEHTGAPLEAWLLDRYLVRGAHWGATIHTGSGRHCTKVSTRWLWWEGRVAARASPAAWIIRNWIILSYIWESAREPDGSLRNGTLGRSSAICARLRASEGKYKMYEENNFIGVTVNKFT